MSQPRNLLSFFWSDWGIKTMPRLSSGHLKIFLIKPDLTIRDFFFEAIHCPTVQSGIEAT
jgi:hypothetical protein